MPRYRRFLLWVVAGALAMLALVACTPGQPPGSGAGAGRQPDSGSRETTGDASAAATLPTVDLDGLLVSLEASTKPLPIEGTKPVVYKPRTGRHLLALRLTAFNSTPDTMTGLRTTAWPGVRDGRGEPPPRMLRANLRGEGALRGSGGHPVSRPRPKGPQGFAPGGRLTATVMYEVWTGRSYTVTWTFSPSRVATFAVP
jgi:hypothetical protein